MHLPALRSSRPAKAKVHLAGFPIDEDNPFLGWRGIRITLDHPDVFLMQIRAMLKANQNLNNLRIMLPMISGVGEVDEALHLIDQAYQEVLEEFGEVEKPQVGGIEQPLIAIPEFTAEQPETDIPMGDVGQADDHVTVAHQSF